ncbi:GntR family transcriptional regulator [Paenibacillus sp. LMG 31461]|uniref:GntR family transcriptional regulator n=1 Tax=Paenibacillus plantarum TaxID=2654975 RepID=A0ABX1X376_9BACL|nr:GntR family transcriptional regulator [Paenibacillus plantarum]NOU62845.1 GntR family transcriptional regulator [Paenibacillus plantarum]
MKQGKTPKYQTIVDDLKQKIATGKFDPNEPLPTQLEFAKIYNTSDITSRRALVELANEGYIYRVRGKGTFIRAVSSERPEARKATLDKIYLAHVSMPLRAFGHRFYSDLIAGIQEVCEEQNIKFYLWDMGHKSTLPEKDESTGFVLLPSANTDPELFRSWKSEERKLVTVHFFYPQLQIPYVIVDNLTGGFLATQHLLSLGHRRIGIVLTGKSFYEMNQEFSLRLQGYRLALSQYNVAFDPELVCIIEENEESEEMGYAGANKLISLPKPPSAIFVTSDYKAVGVIQAVKDHGMRVPEDISVVGYDDTLVSPFIEPSLTTINQNTLSVGRRAAELLIFDWTQYEEGHFIKDEIVPKLIVRDSTRKCFEK